MNGWKFATGGVLATVGGYILGWHLATTEILPGIAAYLLIFLGGVIVGHAYPRGPR